MLARSVMSTTQEITVSEPPALVASAAASFARAQIVDEAAILAGLEQGQLATYVCDFPTRLVKDHPNVVALPHLGASTDEAEENCAIMVAETLRDYLENGNVRNSVNFPEAVLPRIGDNRIAIATDHQDNRYPSDHFPYEAEVEY